MSKRLNVGSKRKKLFNLASVVLHTAGISVGDLEPFITQSAISAAVSWLLQLHSIDGTTGSCKE